MAFFPPQQAGRSPLQENALRRFLQRSGQTLRPLSRLSVLTTAKMITAPRFAVVLS